MGDPPRYPDTSDDKEHERGSAGKPRWAAVLGILLAVAVVVLFVVLHLTGTLGPGAH